MLEHLPKIVGVFSDQEMKKNGTELSSTSQRRNGTRTENAWRTPHEWASVLPMFLPTGTRSAQMQTWKETIVFNAESSTPELPMRMIPAVNQSTIYHAISIWYIRVQKMHPGELDFDLNFSVDDVTL